MMVGGITTRRALRFASMAAGSLALFAAIGAVNAEPAAMPSASPALSQPQSVPDPDADPSALVSSPPADDPGAVDTDPADSQHITDLGTGIASYYGRRFAGHPTASGEIFDPTKLTAAHRTLPFGSLVRVTNPANGRSVVVRINDRGPFEPGRTIDLSRAAAKKVGLIRPGSGKVDLALLDK